MKYILSTLALLLALLPGAQANTAETILAQLSGVIAQAAGSSASQTVPTEGSVEVAFSPNRGALELVLKNIQASRSTLDVMAYSFTSVEVTRALLQATKRGVRVRVLVDQDHNFKPGAGSKPLSALSALVTAGAQVRTVSAYAIFHDKVAISDGRHVQTGSFNYSHAAATRNSENVIVLWNAPQVARVYLEHYERNWQLGQPFTGRGAP